MRLAFYNWETEQALHGLRPSFLMAAEGRLDSALDWS